MPLASLLFVLIVGCAPALRGLRDRELPARALVEGVTAFVQTQHHCGPASLASLLTWAGRPETPEALAPRVYLPGRSGTLPIDLPREVRARGLIAYPVSQDLGVLLAEVGAGHPALVLENRGLAAAPLWHYSVLAGYDLEERTVVLYAGAEFPEKVRLTTFARTWRRGGSFGLLALPPGELPAADDPQGILSALADLEEAGQPGPAARGYEAFIRRWPGDWRGAFGLGNALYTLGDREGADAALRLAHDAAPERPEPLNNLALLVLETGRRDEALGLARTAVENATTLGMDRRTYEETLRRVETQL